MRRENTGGQDEAMGEPWREQRQGGQAPQETAATGGAHRGIQAVMEFDPTGRLPGDAGAKLDAGKPDLSLLLDFGLALSAVGEVSTHGARKYSRGGWQAVPDGANRYTAAMLRHLLAEGREKYDEGSGLAHAAQVAWNALARLELMLRCDGVPDGVSVTGGASRG